MDSNSLINLGDLSKPATVLIEKVSSAVGIIFQPYHIKRMARAEAEAEKIKSIARMELTDLEQRAIDRFVQQESRKQENIEQITVQAAGLLALDAKVEKLEEDWVAHLFKQCDSVSDKEMQSLWAQLLSGEATNPGTFSKRTVDFVSSIDKKDAALFTTFCQFVWIAEEPIPFIDNSNDEIYTKTGITFTALKHLDAIGLISFESTAGYTSTALGKHVHLLYFGVRTTIEFAGDANNNLRLGHVMLTSVGKELHTICGSSRNHDYYKYVISKWFQQGLILSSEVVKRQ